MRRYKHVGDEEEDDEAEEGPDQKPDGNRLIGSPPNDNYYNKHYSLLSF